MDCSITLAGLELTEICLILLPSAETKGMCHHCLAKERNFKMDAEVDRSVIPASLKRLQQGHKFKGSLGFTSKS